MSEDKKASATHYARTRGELAGALGYDIDRLTAAQELRLDNVVALKLVSDTLRAALLRGEQVDHRELLAVTDGLAKLLPKEREPEPTIDERDDPHARLMRHVDNWIAAQEANRRDAEAERVEMGLPADPKDARIAELEAENARLRGEPFPEGERVITPREADVTPPSEQTGGRNLRVGMRPGPDDHRVTRPKPVIDAKAESVELMPDGSVCPPGGRWCPTLRRVVPIPPQARSGAETKAAMDRVNADKSPEYKIMNAPSSVSGEPAPSLGNESWRGNS
jgi:hypothetical protein